MKNDDHKNRYYHLGYDDGKRKAYPLYPVLKLAEDFVSAAAYQTGWRDATGENLRFFRQPDRR